MKNNRARRRRWYRPAFALLALVALLGVLDSPAAMAQTRAALVKDVENPAHAPFVEHGSGTIAVSWANTILDVGSVPVGKRLVIEYVGVHCTGDADESISQVAIWVFKTTSTGWTSYAVPLGVSSTGETWDGKGTWTVGQPLRLYSDGSGMSIGIDIRRKKTSATMTCSATMSGYTVDMP